MTVNVTDGSDIVCTITNTRKTGKLEVVKKLNPTTDAGRFDLRIDNTVEKDEAAHNGTTGEKTLNTGNHTVSETADGETTLTDYTELDRVQGRQRHRRDRGLGHRHGAGDGERHRRLRHRVHDHQHPQDRARSRSSRRSNPTTDAGRFDLQDRQHGQKDEAAARRHDRREDARHRQPHRVRDGRRRDRR